MSAAFSGLRTPPTPFVHTFTDFPKAFFSAVEAWRDGDFIFLTLLYAICLKFPWFSDLVFGWVGGLMVDHYHNIHIIINIH